MEQLINLIDHHNAVWGTEWEDWDVKRVRSHYTIPLTDEEIEKILKEKVE